MEVDANDNICRSDELCPFFPEEDEEISSSDENNFPTIIHSHYKISADQLGRKVPLVGRPMLFINNKSFLKNIADETVLYIPSEHSHLFNPGEIKKISFLKMSFDLSIGWMVETTKRNFLMMLIILSQLICPRIMMIL